MKKKSNTIHFIITGGTIDSQYSGVKDTAVPNDKSIIPKFIESLKLYTDSVFTEVCMKDSRDLTKKDLKKILTTVDKSSYKHIIVTHGTYTVGDTARYIEVNKKKKDQVVILTASTIPIQGFSPSDGPFNLGFAVAKAMDLEPGVYVAINGKVFEPQEVMKVLSQGRFTSVFQR